MMPRRMRLLLLPVTAVLLMSAGGATVNTAGSSTTTILHGWIAGEWSGCLHGGCGARGIETRPVVCARLQDREFVDVRYCGHVTKPSDTRPCFRVCDHHRDTYSWSVTGWSECRPTGPCRQGARPGVSHRNVTCVGACHTVPPASGSIDAAGACLLFSPKPESQRPCTVKCRRDCVTTDVGPETGCDSCWSRWRIRHHTVLLGPTEDGHECTNLADVSACPPNDECHEFRHTNYRYRLGRWSNCTAFHPSQAAGNFAGVDRQLNSRGFTSVIGYRRRIIDCIDPSGEVFEKSFCSHHKKPTSGTLCVLQTHERSAAGDHTDWTSYDDSLFSYQARNRLVPDRADVSSPKSSADSGEATVSLYRHVSLNSSFCTKYRWLIGSWGECVLQQSTDACGTGIQNRTVLCVTAADSMPVSDYFCASSSEPEEHTRSCTVPCPQPCIVSEWSDWSDSLPDRCRLERSKSKDEYRQRTRTIISDAEHSGQACPHLEEHQPYDYLPCYAWRTTASGDCKLKYPDMQCGEGLRNRTVECYSVHGSPVSSRLCNDPKPTHVEICYVACANDCVTSEWSNWSSCSRTCSVGRVVGHRTRFRDILAYAGQDGTPCPPLRMLIEKERCAEVSCHVYHWQTGLWNPCQPVATTTGERPAACADVDGAKCRQNDATSCGAGVQVRDVQCYKSTGEKLPPKRCLPELMPPMSRNCTVPCTADCVVSAFTEWSPCSVTCISDDTEFLPIQRRSRFVLVRPTSTGSRPCPDLHETRPCMNLARCRTYRWQTTDWSQCMFHSHQDKCGAGYRAREVRCVSDKDEYVADELCVYQRGLAPSLTQPCTVRCDQDACKFSDWSEWSACTRRCGGFQTRTRSMEGTTSRIAECYDRIKFPVEDQRACPCPKHSVQLLGIWSHCRLDAGLTPFDRDLYERSIGQMRPGRGYCGVGVRSHALVCVGPEGHNVSAFVCNSSEYMEEMCFVPCARDCQLSDWSAWSTCRTNGRCGNGYRTRSRYVIEPSLDGGRDCPPTLADGEENEKIPCHVPCDQFEWHSEEWSMCTGTGAAVSKPNSTYCGPGMQSRIVRCIRLLADGEFEDIDETNCDKLLRPFEINFCQLPCPGNCVVTSWTPWSNCTQGCVGQTRRRRSRTIVRHPARVGLGGGEIAVAAGNGGTTTVPHCPHLEEFERCDSVMIGCRTYAWHWTEWSHCLLPDSMPAGDVSASGVIKVGCGAGRLLRYAECRRSDDEVVAEEFCRNTLPPLTDASEESCYVPCPVDCVVSDWSTWSECSLTCGLGVRTRTRSVVVPTQHGGRHCPEPLTQNKFCAFRECFQWRLSEWGKCHTEAGGCGYGFQRRNASCVRHDEVAVDDAYCSVGALSLLVRIQPCVIACPGDCLVSDWSSWGPCHRPCESHPSVPSGEQTRSRVVLVPSQLPGGIPCPDDLVQVRPCPATGYCPSYAWHASFWSAHSSNGGSDVRVVTCQRSDGLVVYGACPESEKSAANVQRKDCTPTCIVPHSLCDRGECVCPRGFEGVYAGGHLQQCHRGLTDVSQKEADIEPGPTWLYAICGALFILILVAAVTVIACSRRRIPDHDVKNWNGPATLTDGTTDLHAAAVGRPSDTGHDRYTNRTTIVANNHHAQRPYTELHHGPNGNGNCKENNLDYMPMMTVLNGSKTISVNCRKTDLNVTR